MGHGQDGERTAELRHVDAQILLTEVDIAPQRTVRQHDSLGEACGARGVVDHAELIRAIDMPADIVHAEGVGEFASEEFVQALTGIRELFVPGGMQREVGQIEDALQLWHLIGIDDIHHVVAHKEQLRLGMIHDVVNLLAIELMKNGHNDGPIGEGGQEGHCPVG